MKYWNNEGTYQAEYEKLAEELMPPMGASGTVGGEMLRAVSRIYHDAYNNGFCNNTSDAFNYLAEMGSSELDVIMTPLAGAVNTGDYTEFETGDKIDTALDMMVDHVVKMLIDDPDVAMQKTDDDMNDFRDADFYPEEDEDDSWM